jgi:ADP-ribose pyrophosphatase YjhB (NUDIX family)
VSGDPRLEIRFCPLCGHEGLELRVPRRDDRLRPVCLNCGYVHYVGPVVAAGVILHDGDRLCLVRRAHEPGLGLWTFPGGFVDLDEEVPEAALREAVEETGCRGEIERLVGVYNSLGPRGKRVVIVIYAARLVGDGGGGSEEVAEVRWFTRDELPWDEFAFSSSTLALRDYLRSGPGC